MVGFGIYSEGRVNRICTGCGARSGWADEKVSRIKDSLAPEQQRKR